jgi:uracil-DNA glycosylase
MSQRKLSRLLTEIRACTVCAEHLRLGPRPVLEARHSARILIAGQAPGTRVHETGIPWNDPSGNRLREWMNIDRETFYDDRRIAIIPMGFCYPGRGKSGDLPPRPECADLWMDRLMDALPNVELVIAIGQYSQAYHLGDKRKTTLTETVRSWRDYGKKYLPLPHPSPRNNIWLTKNAWFEKELLPVLRRRSKALLK